MARLPESTQRNLRVFTATGDLNSMRLRKLTSSILGRLENWIIRFQVWQFERNSVPVSVQRSCGHVDNTRLARKNLDNRLAVYRVTDCPACRFHAIMAESAERGL